MRFPDEFSHHHRHFDGIDRTDDPDRVVLYFYFILPYAYVFGLTDKWAKNFERLSPQTPEWNDGPA